MPGDSGGDEGMKQVGNVAKSQRTGVTRPLTSQRQVRPDRPAHCLVRQWIHDIIRPETNSNDFGVGFGIN